MPRSATARRPVSTRWARTASAMPRPMAGSGGTARIRSRRSFWACSAWPCATRPCTWGHSCSGTPPCGRWARRRSRSQGVARGAGLGQGHALLRALRVPPHRTVGQDVHPSPFGVNGMPVEEGGGEGRGRFSPPPCFLSNRFRRPAVHFLGGRALPSESNWASCPMALPVLARAPVSSRIRSPVSAVRRASLSWSMAAFTWLR